MADHVKAANAIYKNTDFNGDGKFEGRLNFYSSAQWCAYAYPGLAQIWKLAIQNVLYCRACSQL